MNRPLSQCTVGVERIEVKNPNLHRSVLFCCIAPSENRHFLQQLSTCFDNRSRWWPAQCVLFGPLSEREGGGGVGGWFGSLVPGPEMSRGWRLAFSLHYAIRPKVSVRSERSRDVTGAIDLLMAPQQYQSSSAAKSSRPRASVHSSPPLSFPSPGP